MQINVRVSEWMKSRRRRRKKPLAYAIRIIRPSAAAASPLSIHFCQESVITLKKGMDGWITTKRVEIGGHLSVYLPPWWYFSLTIHPPTAPAIRLWKLAFRRTSGSVEKQEEEDFWITRHANYVLVVNVIDGQCSASVRPWIMMIMRRPTVQEEHQLRRKRKCLLVHNPASQQLRYDNEEP